MEPLLYIRKKVRKLVISVWLGQGIIKVVTTFGIGICIYMLLDYFVFLSSNERVLFLVALWIIGIGSSLVHKFNPLTSLEQTFPQFKGRLFVSLSNYPPQIGYSAALIDKIRDQTCELLKSVDLRKIIKREITLGVKLLIMSCIFVGIGISSLPSPKSIWIKRLFFPKNKYLSLIVSPGDIKVPYQDSVKVKVKPSPLSPRKLFLMINQRKIPLYKTQGFETQLEITNDVSYYAKLRDIASDTHKILVMIRPWVKSLELTYTYPLYTKISPFTTTSPSIDALYGTRIELQGKSNILLDSAKICFKNMDTLSTATDGCEFYAKFNVTQNDSYKILLFAANGLTNAHPKSWKIRVWEDEFPMVEVLFPAKDIEIPVNMEIPIIFQATDDYGISQTKLISDKGEWKISGKITKDTVLTYNWDLTEMSLFPGDIVKYWIEVYDNDVLRGPKVAKSSQYIVYFPRLEDIYQKLTQEEEKSISEFKDISQELESLGNKLEEMAHLSYKSLSAKEKEELKKTLTKMKEIRDKIKEIAKNLDNLYKMAERSLWLDREVVDKLKELQELFEELPQLTDNIRKVEELLRKNPELLSNALKDLKITQEELMERIERTIALLKQFKKEQMLKAVAEKAKELEEWQKDITKRTREGESLSSISEEEEKLREELNKLTEDLKELSKEMPSLSKELNKEIERAKAIQKQLSKISASLSMGRRPLSKQDEASNQLSTMASNLSSLYQQMVQQGKEYVMQEIKALREELLFLSFEEEALKGKPLHMAFRQEAIIKGTKNVENRVKALSKLTPFIPQSISKSISTSLSSMEEAKRKFEEDSVAQARKAQMKAMAEFNKAVEELINSEEKVNKSCSGSGIPQLMQQLSQLTQSQEALNQLVRSFLPLNLSTSEMRGQLLQLSAQQQALADELKRIAEGLRGKVLGDLGGTAQEMERIAEDLKKGITEEIIKRQERVLKRLLDSQKSIYTRKRSKGRISEPGRDFSYLPSPPSPKLITKRGISQAEILKALKSKYPKQYESLIRAYFRALSTK